MLFKFQNGRHQKRKEMRKKKKKGQYIKFSGFNHKIAYGQAKWQNSPVSDKTGGGVTLFEF